MKRVSIAVVLIIIAAGAWYAYKEYHRTNKDLKNVKASFVFSAPNLISRFEKDTATANKQFVDKVIAVTGLVKTIDAKGNPVVIALGESGVMSSVQCSMDSAHAKDYAAVQEGDRLTIKGLCTGGRTLDLFGTDVILSRCVIAAQ